MWSPKLIAFTAALSALAMSASAIAEARAVDDENGNWVLSVAVDAHRMDLSSQLEGSRGKKSMARDYARVLDALSRAMQRRSRRRRDVPPENNRHKGDR